MRWWTMWRSVVAAAGMSVGAPATVASARALTLTIHPPAGFTAKQSSPDSGDEVTYEIVSTGDPDTGCSATFTTTRTSGKRDQARINADAAAPGYAVRVKAELADLFDVRRVDRFAMQGADGAVVIGDPKSGEGAIRSAIIVVETPRGKLRVACVASKDEFDAWRPVFERVARGVTLPR